MTTIAKTTVLGFTLAALLTAGCKKKESYAESGPVIIPPPAEAGPAHLLPLRLGTEKSAIRISYTADSALAAVSYPGGKKLVVLYNSKGMPEILEKYSGNVLAEIRYLSFNPAGQLKQVDQYLVKNEMETFNGYFTVAYSQAGLPGTLNFYDARSKPADVQQLNFDAAGQLVSSTVKGTLQGNYTYDQGKGLFSHVRYAWLAALDGEDPLFLSAAGNLLQCSFPAAPGNDRSYSYVYHTTQYPGLIRQTVAGVTTEIPVSYQ